MYIADGGADMAVPPLKALLYMMRDGEYEGMTLTSPEFRAMWSRENILKSDWYMERLKCFQTKETDRLQRGLEYMEHFIKGPDSHPGDWKGKQIVEDLQLHDRITSTKKQLETVKKPDFLKHLVGSLGVEESALSYALKKQGIHEEFRVCGGNMGIDERLPKAVQSRAWLEGGLSQSGK